MTEEERIEEAVGKLLDAMVQFRRLRDVPYRGKQPGEHRCRHSDMMILFALKQMEPDFPEGVSIKELSLYLNLKSPTVTPAAYHLEKMNLVERSTDRRDRRINRVRLTGDGRRFLFDHQKKFNENIRGLVECLGMEKSLMLAELLNEAYLYEYRLIQKNRQHCNP
jgi:DNA-binding MarR family transcriptional regulator